MKWFKIAMVIALLFTSASLMAEQQVKYFGYYANNGTIGENYNHTNVAHIGVWTSDRAQATSLLLSQLATAKADGVQVILSVDPFLFVNGGGSCPYSNQSQAGQYWATFVNQLVDNGYLVPGDPAHSTVLAFYPVDEPNLCGLNDVNGQANPALANAINTIRSNPDTDGFPVAVIMGHNYTSAIAGMRLYDWVGMDDYGVSTGSYLSEMDQVASNLDLSWQHIMLVPQAATGGDLDNSYQDPDTVFSYARNHSSVIALIPFLWSHSGSSGTRDIPALLESYTHIGLQVKLGLFSQFVSQSVPTQMDAGHTYQVTVKFKNIGSAVWKTGQAFSLGSRNPRDNDTWGLHRVHVASDIAPGQTATFTFTVTAPSQVNTYNFQWQMVDDNVTWFGSPSPNVVVQVRTPASGYVTASPDPCTIYSGQTTCTVSVNWSSNRSDAEIWVSNADGSGPQLFARAQSGTQAATWITTNHVIFTLKSGAESISSVGVYGVKSSNPPPGSGGSPCPLALKKPSGGLQPQLKYCP